jgi:hypothetical protein
MPNGQKFFGSFFQKRTAAFLKHREQALLFEKRSKNFSAVFRRAGRR